MNTKFHMTCDVIWSFTYSIKCKVLTKPWQEVICKCSFMPKVFCPTNQRYSFYNDTVYKLELGKWSNIANFSVYYPINFFVQFEPVLNLMILWLKTITSPVLENFKLVKWGRGLPLSSIASLHDLRHTRAKWSHHI